MSVTLHMLSGQIVVFESNYPPPTDANNETFVFDAPMLNTLYEVACTPSFIMGGYDVTNKTVNGFKLIWNNASQMSQPGAPILADNGAGNVNAGTHSYLVTFVNANNKEGPAGVTASVNSLLVAAGARAINISSVALSAGFQVAKRNIYRNKIASPTSFFLLTTLNDNTTTVFADNVADSGLGAALPGSLDLPPVIFLRVKR